MKPSGGATPFLASSLEPRHHARGYSRVQGAKGAEIVMGSVGPQSKTFSVGPFSSWTSQVGHH
eukprot:7091064-Prymnesium_polylepis.1